MIDYKKLIEKYNEDYTRRINDNKDKLLEAFVIYYGEEYRELIMKRFNNIIFSWYVGDFIDNIYSSDISKKIEEQREKHISEIQKILGLDFNKCDKEELIFYLYDESELTDIDYENNTLYNFFSLDASDQKELLGLIYGYNEIPRDINERMRKVITYIGTMKEKDKEENICANFYVFYKWLEDNQYNFSEHGKILGATNSILFSEEYREFLDAIKDYITDCPYSIESDFDKSLILIPILYTTDKGLIHEINHSIVASKLAKVEKNGSESYIVKDGFSNEIIGEDSEDEEFEEMINDRSAIEITDIFHLLGGNIFDRDVYVSKIKESYGILFPLIEKFYQRYKQIIKKSRITDNGNLIYSCVEKDILKKYKSFIAAILYSLNYNVFTGYSRKDSVNSSEIEKAEEMVNLMDKQPQEKISLEEYVKELESQGRKVTVLNPNSPTVLESQSRRR